MENYLKHTFVLFLLYSGLASAVSFDSSFSLEIKTKQGGSTGEVVMTHPKIKGTEVKSGIAKIHNFLNFSALSNNRIQAISYVCINEQVVIFQKKEQSLTGTISSSSFFTSGRVAKNLFPAAFRWLSEVSGMNGSDPSRLACRSDFLVAVENYRLENLKNIKIGKYTLTQKKSLFRSKITTILSW